MPVARKETRIEITNQLEFPVPIFNYETSTLEMRKTIKEVSSPP